LTAGKLVAYFSLFLNKLHFI